MLKVESGNGFARQLGYPTVNVYRESEDCGVFFVEDSVLGPGIAFVMPKLTEVHFLSPVHEPRTLDLTVISKIDPPENGILDYFYKGLEYAKNSQSVT